MKDYKRHFVVVLISVLLIFGTLLGIYIANRRAAERANERAEAVLLDSAREQADTLAATLDGQFEVLQGLASALSGVSLEDAARVDALLSDISDAEELSFASIALLRPDGSKVTADAAYSLTVGDRAYFRQALSGVPAMERILGRQSGEPCIAMAVPYYRNGQISGVLRGIFYEADLRALLSSRAYGGGGYSFLVDSLGNVIVNAVQENDFLQELNIFSVLKSADFSSGFSLQTLRLDLQNGQSTTLRYRLNGEERIAVLTPFESASLPENDWFIFNVVPTSLLAGEVRSSRSDALEAMSIFAAFALVALALFLFLERDHRRTQAREAEITRQREEQFRIVTEQSGKFVMRYDIPSRTAYLNETQSDCFQGASSYVDAAEEIIRRGYIDPCSEADYRAFFRQVDAGTSPVSANILMILPDGSRRWYKHDATTIFDRKQRPRTAIISYSDDTEQRERELAYAKWQQELESVSADDIALYEWNLTRDLAESHRGRLVVDYSGLAHDGFNERTAVYTEAYVCEEDRAAYTALMNREHLLTQYYGGVYLNSLDYRFLTDSGGQTWRRVSVQLVPYPDSQDIKAYVTNRNIDAEKREELALLARTQQDFLTGALNRETFIQQVGELLAHSPGSTHALLMLDIDGFKQVNDMLGHDAGDTVLSDFVGFVRTALRASDIVGRIGGDEFMVCLPDMPFDAAIAKKAAQLCAALRRQLNEQLSISVSIGIAVYPRDGVCFEALYRCADAALYHTKGRGKDSYTFYQTGMAQKDSLSPPEAAPAAAPVPTSLRPAVLVVTGEEATYKALRDSLWPEYDALRAGSAAELSRLLGSGPAIYAAILDTDSPQGLSLLTSDGKRLSESGLTLYALTGDRSEENYIRLIQLGVTLSLAKPASHGLLQLRLDQLYEARSAERARLQSAYRRLQNTEELRYREVLAATGTTVFIYDVATRSYQADLLDHQATSGTYAGHGLGDELVEKGIAAAEDIARIRQIMDQVAAGAEKRADEVLRLRTRAGQQRWFHVQIMPMENTDALTPKLLLTVNDVNERIEADQALRCRAERDALTGLYNRETFFEKAATAIAAQEAGYYVMACFDIDNFKLINDQYGIVKGDEVLCRIADIFRRGFEPVGGILCRIMADNFAVLYPRSFMETPEIAAIRRAASRPDPTVQAITFSIGRYLVSDPALPVSAMFDRASIAESSVKGRFDVHIAQYDERMREQILREQEIINDMDTALADGQFEVCLQPQYNHSTGAMIGAEALVRWHHPRRGPLPPSEFISVFERVGFIYELDKYVWEYTCRLLRKWLDAGRAPLPVSVNVSRYDAFREDFYEVITGLVEQYRLPPALLRLEITETAFARVTEKIVSVVQRLLDYGFLLEIDDFGSGYSSLNTLKDVPANVLKLDMRFLEGKGNTRRGGNILESVVRMAKWLGMSVIAEGVETRTQADYLRSIGCNYVQGYLYAHPLSVEEYEALAAGSGKEREMIALETVESLDNDAFWDPDSMETLIFNSYVGGACIFEFHDDKTELLRVNEKYAQTVGGAGMSIETALGLPLERLLDAADLETLYANIRRAAASGEESTCEIRLHGVRPDAACVHLRSTVRVVARASDRLLLYCSVIDMTAQREAEQKERESAAQLRLMMENVNGGVTAVTLCAGAPHFLFANDRYYEQLGYTRAQFLTEVPDAFALVHPDDRAAVTEQTHRASLARESFTCTYRAIRRDGSVIWLQSNISLTAFPGVREPVQLAVANDVTAQREAEQQILETSVQLRFLNDVARDLLSESDADTAIKELLRKILAYFDGNRAYVFELDYERQVADNSYEVCAPHVSAERDRLHAVPLSALDFWLHAFDQRDHISIEDVDRLGPDRAAERQVLQAQSIRSLVAVPLRRDGRLLGFMGVDDPRRQQTHVSHLEALGDYMAVVLNRRDLNARISRDRDMLSSLLDGGATRPAQ